MMMMGLYVMKDVPFRDVYLHALVRDENGEKMSKSKGNSIDPLEMMDKFGTDAFRFTLAAFTAQGRDVRMSEERIEGNKYFINKIWNATRFSMMNLDDLPAGMTVARLDLSIADRWILARLNKTVAEVIRGLDEYRFNDAAAAVYQFIWHEFCDWYLELIKPVLYGKDDPAGRRAAQQTLVTVLKRSLLLLHPFMPFLTEEIWQALSADGGSVMVGAFPAPDEGEEDPEAERELGLIMEVVTRVRNIRGEMNVAPSLKLRATLSVPDAAGEATLERGRVYITNLANLEALTITRSQEEPKGTATAVAGPVRIYVFLAGVIDIAGERARLAKEIGRIDKDLAVVQKKLENPAFLEKAAEAVVRKEKEKARDLTDRRAALEAALRRLEVLAAEG
jgi:valyl-tRNA synthetase